MPSAPCAEPGCASPAVQRGRCDRHARQLERNRSRGRRGGLKRGGDGYDEVVAQRDRDAAYRYPTRRSDG
jgi:hypothetical protein